MVSWQLMSIFCLTLWRLEVWASPTSRQYAEGSVIYNPSHILDYKKVHDNIIVTPNLTQLPAEGSSFSRFPDKNESKRKLGAIKTTRIRRTPTGFSARGFHEEVFDRDFGHFSPVKRRPESDASGFYGDTFSGGFGEFETMKRKMPSYGYKAMSKMDMVDPRYLLASMPQQQQRLILDGKRSPEMTKSGFHSDVFNGGFGEFHPM